MSAAPADMPAPSSLVVIGASAGGLAPLRTIARALPPGFPGAVLVVVHLASTASSVLPQILARVSDLAVEAADDGAQLRPGRMLVAPPDRHLTVEDGVVRVTRGPRENGHRPAVDPLFRSAAEVYGAACRAVILSGSRDDGAVGMAQVKARGGVTIVQDPSQAEHDGMPAHALAATDVDLVLGADDIGPTLVRLATQRGAGASAASPGAAGSPRRAELLSILCPECGGSLFEDHEAGVSHVRCHVGHRFSVRSLLAAHAEAVERALWTSVRSLEDRATLLRRMADRARQTGSTISAARFDTQAIDAIEQASSVRGAIAALDDAGIEPPADPNESVA
ncbi:MAG TPA: chemotaxis protein CheB [Baekduia sp.]|nr:chemotaxis protein CheB [Baekduia sp.]